MQSVFSQVKNRAGVFLQFVDFCICFVLFLNNFNIEESGSKRGFSTSVFLQLKNRAGVFLHFNRFSNFCNVLTTPNSLKNEISIRAKRTDLSNLFGSFSVSFLAEIREYRR